MELHVFWKLRPCGHRITRRKDILSQAALEGRTLMATHRVKRLWLCHPLWLFALHTVSVTLQSQKIHLLLKKNVRLPSVIYRYNPGWLPLPTVTMSLLLQLRLEFWCPAPPPRNAVRGDSNGGIPAGTWNLLSMDCFKGFSAGPSGTKGQRQSKQMPDNNRYKELVSLVNG